MKGVIMTRGSAYCFHVIDNVMQIAFTDEWNGGMAPHDLGDKLIDKMSRSRDVTEFMFACYEFNKENHNYTDFKCHTLPLHRYLENNDEILHDPLGGNIPYEINMADDYYRYWFSDYTYFVNLSDKPIRFSRDTTNLTLLLMDNQTTVLNFGKPMQVAPRSFVKENF